MSAPLAIRCDSSQSFADLIKLVVVNADDGTPYIDCDNKDEDLLSIFKRMLIELDDGTLAVQVYDVS